jgi:hypothetical protein
MSKFSAAMTLAALCFTTAAFSETTNQTRKDVYGNDVKLNVVKGSYASCVANGKKLGYSQEAAARFCVNSRGLRPGT